MQKRKLLENFAITVKMPEERTVKSMSERESLFYELQKEEKPARLSMLPLIVFKEVPLEQMIYVRNQGQWATWLLQRFQETNGDDEVNSGIDAVLKHFARTDVHFLHACFTYRNLPLFRAFLLLLKVMKDEDPEVVEKYPALDYEKPQKIFGSNPPRSFQQIILSEWTPNEGKEEYIAEMFKIMTDGMLNNVTYFNGLSKI